jgi:hypothetical protein
MTKLERKRLECLLYLVMRDSMTSGKMESILEPLEEVAGWWNEKETFKYSAPPLQEYAKWIVDRLEQTSNPEPIKKTTPKPRTKKR